MSVAASAMPGIIARVVGWIVKAFSGAAAGRSVPNPALMLPTLFLARAPSRQAPADGAARPAVSATCDRGFAARLRSVSAQNVPKSRKGPRRKLTPPGGKAIPKKAPRLLKRYKPSGGTLLAAARSRMARLPSLPLANVVHLADFVRRQIGCGRTVDRHAA